MSSLTTISISEEAFDSSVFTLSVSLIYPNGATQEEKVYLPNPYNPQTEALLEWYFEQYLYTPYDDVKEKAAVACLKDYGTGLFKQLFIGKVRDSYRSVMHLVSPDKRDKASSSFVFEIVGNTPAFQAIYWESLWDPDRAYPLAAKGNIFLRKNINSRTVIANVQPSPTLNLLIVTARPGEEDDVNYRTIQKPLVELTEDTTTHVRVHILRPGTYEALVRHLEDKAGDYHIVHFDLHGSLLDYPTYRDLWKEARKVPFPAIMFKGSYALSELSEADFNGGTRAFLFFESNEKGVAVPVDAGQLAAQLEYKQIPICILNACQSAKQDASAHETSLGRVLIQTGIQVVLAMRYSISVTAAKLLMETLYQGLYEGQPIEKAIAQGRVELYNKKNRQAVYNYCINLEDWLLPVLYQNARPELELRKPTEEEEILLQKAAPNETKKSLEYVFFGRDLDILKIEKNLLVRSNILLLQGMGGVGKTTLLQYLSDWWLKTGFIEMSFYFGYHENAHTLTQILKQIAEKIYTRLDEYESFQRLPSPVQEARMVKELRARRYALLLDNTESITGEKLAIPNTLPAPERAALKGFLSQLKGGQSVVLIGSRSGEEWLRHGTFNNNCYVLQGLDPEAAEGFANCILQNMGLATKTAKEDSDFERLMKLLAGYPLALKAILPNLKQKTAGDILAQLQNGAVDLDKGNDQEKTKSIVKCIEYAHSNLSDNAQKLLLCLAPFQSVINLAPNVIKNYFDALQKESQFKDYPFHELEQVVQEAVQNGFMQEGSSNASAQLITLQPVFTYFLKNKLGTEISSLKQSLERAFISHYRYLSSWFNELITSKVPKDKQRGEWIIGQEYENLFQVLNLLLVQQVGVKKIVEVMIKYLDKRNLHAQQLAVVEMVYGKMHRYDAQVLAGETGYDFLRIKLILANAYLTSNQYNKALQNLEELEVLYDTHPYINQNPDLQRDKGSIYHAFGNVALNRREFHNAEDYYQKAMNVYEHYQDVFRQGQIYTNLGITAMNQKESQRAGDYWQKALAIFEQYQDLFEQGQVYQNLGLNAHQYENAFQKAKDYLHKALAKYEQDQNVFMQGRAFINLGAVSRKQQDYQGARDYYHKALAIFVPLNDFQRQGMLYFNLGVAAHEQRDYEGSEDYWQKALAIFVNRQDVHSQGQVNHYLADAAQKQQNYKGAKDYFHKALDQYLQFPESIVYIENILPDILVFSKLSGEIAFGKAMYEKALPLISHQCKIQLQAMYDALNQL